MQQLISWVLVTAVSVLAVPSITFCIEIFAGICLRRRPARYTQGRCGRAVVLVPAHNESNDIVPTLEDIKAQLRSWDLLLVVADNCNDDTAKHARLAGAVVLERHDMTRRGKGYALDWGIQHIEKDPPATVVMIDADCRLEEGAIETLISACSTTGRPAQALYLMKAPDGSEFGGQISEFAWRVKNWVRPLGLAVFGFPCQLMGSGMAFPWHVIRTADLAGGWIVEDLKLGLELAAAGYLPLFCPGARVTSRFAASAQGAGTQRARWQHGHMASIFKLAPRSICIAIARRNFSLLALSLDLVVPPLSLLTLMLLLLSLVAALAFSLGTGYAAFLIIALVDIGFASAVIFAWMTFGQEVMDARAMLSLPNYILEKIGIYRQMLYGKMTATWIRTDRGKS